MSPIQSVGGIKTSPGLMGLRAMLGGGEVFGESVTEKE